MRQSCRQGFLLLLWSHVSCALSIYIYIYMYKQFTYGVFREGVIEEKVPQNFANFRGISALFPGTINRIFDISADFLQNFWKIFRKDPFADDSTSELLTISLSSSCFCRTHNVPLSLSLPSLSLA